jgi:hypothetical protein
MSESDLLPILFSTGFPTYPLTYSVPLCVEAALGGQRERLGHPVQAQQGGSRGEEDAAQVQELGPRQGQNQQCWHCASFLICLP